MTHLEVGKTAPYFERVEPGPQQCCITTIPLEERFSKTQAGRNSRNGGNCGNRETADTAGKRLLLVTPGHLSIPHYLWPKGGYVPGKCTFVRQARVSSLFHVKTQEQIKLAI